MSVLVNGGAGYIGSHTCVELLSAGYEVLVFDNLSNSSVESLVRVKKITGKDLTFVKGDVRDESALEALFKEHSIDCVIHFAGLKAVGESCEKPLYYYEHNVAGSITLLKVMAKFNCKKFVFSSSATVYGDPASSPITEDFPVSTTNPYGASKLMIEDMLRDVYQSDNAWDIAILRYFNPVGAHISGLIGEDPTGVPNNLMPYITQVAVGKLECLNVFGDDYDTKDGSGVRDYIHVVDLANGHVKAIAALQNNHGCIEYNLGKGDGVSVFEMISAFETVTSKPINFKVTPRRAGDVASYFADSALANKKLNWQAEHSLEQMVADAWRWQQNNPNGYGDAE